MKKDLWVLFSVIFVIGLPSCLSIDDDVLLKEGRRNKRADDTNPLEATVSQLAQEVTSLKAQLAAMSNRVDNVAAMPGSTYVRWGREDCPSHSQLVYSGRAGGSDRENPGRSPNRLCLPMTPQYDDTPSPNYYGRLYGARYLQISNHHQGIVPCSVCHVPHSATVMIPAMTSCPTDWTVQYSGHLASEDHNHASIEEYVCLDGDPHDVPGSTATQGSGSYFYYTISVCGSLPCPPYVQSGVVTCVVCSK